MPHEEFFQELRKDHKEVTDILDQLKSQSSGEGGDLFMRLKREITPHLEAEEDAFYKVLSNNQEAHQIALKGMEEHHVTEIVLKELDQMPRNDRWQAKLSVFDELVREHIKEEESQVFNAARALNESQIDEILGSFRKEKQQIKSKMG